MHSAIPIVLLILLLIGEASARQPAAERSTVANKDAAARAPRFVVNTRHDHRVHSFTCTELYFRFAIRRWETVTETTKCSQRL